MTDARIENDLERMVAKKSERKAISIGVSFNSCICVAEGN